LTCWIIAGGGICVNLPGRDAREQISVVHSTCVIIAGRRADTGIVPEGDGQMNKAEILMLFDYSAWANRRILDAAEGLSQE